ncbi:MAG: hypothetical protein ACREEK_11925, partial [Bradyrhizobium sp.]
MVPTGWALLIEPRRKVESLAIGFITFIAASLVTLWIFGPGLLDIVLDVPGLAQIASAMGVPSAPVSKILPLTISPMDPVLPLREVPVYFYMYFFRPYFALSVITLAVIALRIYSVRREPSERYVKPIDLLLAYFWITTILHYLLSLSYCVNCITPYTNYFLPVGALGVAALLGEISRLMRGPRPAYAAFGCVCIIAAFMQAFPSFPTLLRPQSGKVQTAAVELSTQLRPHLPTTGRILVLCDTIEASQAVWLAGGVIEPRSLYLPANFREPRAGLTKDERDRVDSIVWDAGYWNDESMRRALPRDYRNLLIERRSKYSDTIVQTVRDGIPFGDLVAAHFQLVTKLKIGERTFELYQRRD